MLFYQVGEFFQSLAVKRSRKSISDLMDIRPDSATVRRNGELVVVAPETVSIGELIVVKPGEKIPLDGIVTEGESMLDTRALTGESVPRSIRKGEEALSGCVNQSGVLTIKVTKSFGESTVTKIIDLVENASSEKHLRRTLSQHLHVIIHRLLLAWLLFLLLFRLSFLVVDGQNGFAEVLYS